MSGRSEHHAGQSSRAGSRVARAVLGPAVRRLRREAQWRSRGLDYNVGRQDAPFHFTVAEHETPLFRPLSGLDERLQQNKAVNLQLAATRLDGVVLLPGQRLSLWREVGKPTYRRGFLDGMILSHGTITAGVGGGLCQMSNLLYWMTLHTPLAVVERWRHSYDVFPDAGRTQPFGSGATVAWPALDLQIENPTSAAYRLSVAVSEAQLAGSWTATEPVFVEYAIEERGHEIVHEAPGAYVRRNELWRIERDLLAATTDERLVARNRAFMTYQPFLAEGSQDAAVPG